MRESRPTQQHFCKQCDQLTEHHMTVRTGSDKLERSDCTVCKRRHNESKRLKGAEKIVETREAASNRIIGELEKKYGVTERHQREATAVPESEPVQAPPVVVRTLAGERRAIALALAKLRATGKEGWWTPLRRTYPG